MASKGVFVNPQSRTLKTKPNLGANKDTTPESIFLGEVIDVSYTGKRSGCIIYRGGNIASGVDSDSIQNVAQPLLSNIKAYPIKGEVVLIFYFGNTYYLPLNLLNNPVVNKLPATVFSKSLSAQQKDSSKLIPEVFNLSNKKIFITPSYEGDVVFEGRFGQSIKFGSTIKYNDEPVTSYSRSDISENGDPITIIRNGSKNPEESILLDDASIYMCSTQRIIIDNNSVGFDGITAAWSTINVNSQDYQAETDDMISNVEMVEMGQSRDEALAAAATATNPESKEAASERAKYLSSQMSSGQHSATTVTGSIEPIPTTITQLRKKIVAYAQQDAAIPTVEAPPQSNSGPRVNQMLANTGLGPGNFWCAAAVTTWYKSAGADVPPSGAASCDTWYLWAKGRGKFSSKPVQGAAILYGSTSDAHHIGIVESINSDGTITTIEGNTSGGSNFNRNGGGVFRKRPRSGILGYVIPTKNGVNVE